MEKNPYRQILNAVSGEILVERARWCDSFGSKLRGFTFRRSLAPGEGLVLVDSSDSRINSGITMFFCFMELGIVWVNGDGEVVDTTIARPWRPSYLPQAPARYAIEADPGLVERVRLGDHLKFVEHVVSADEKEKAALSGSPQN
jgi:uncharacterized membrane protein (UPF0127 family)